MASNQQVNTLAYVMPKAGFRWASGRRSILLTEKRDVVVRKLLKKATEPAKFNRQAAEPLLVEIFTRAAIVARAHTEPFDGPTFRLNMRKFVAFASSEETNKPALANKVWNDLVRSILEARADWVENPTYPYQNHGPLAGAIDEFNLDIAGKWDQVVSSDGLTLEDLAGEDAGDSEGEGWADEEAEPVFSDAQLWAFIRREEGGVDEMAADMQGLVLEKAEVETEKTETTKVVETVETEAAEVEMPEVEMPEVEMVDENLAGDETHFAAVNFDDDAMDLD